MAGWWGLALPSSARCAARARQRRRKKEKGGKGKKKKKEKEEKGEKEKEKKRVAPTGFAAAVGHARAAAFGRSAMSMWNEGKERDLTVIGTGVGTADRREKFREIRISDRRLWNDLSSASKRF